MGVPNCFSWALTGLAPADVVNSMCHLLHSKTQDRRSLDVHLVKQHVSLSKQLSYSCFATCRDRPVVALFPESSGRIPKNSDVVSTACLAFMYRSGTEGVRMTTHAQVGQSRRDIDMSPLLHKITSKWQPPFQTYAENPGPDNDSRNFGPATDPSTTSLFAAIRRR